MNFNNQILLRFLKTRNIYFITPILILFFSIAQFTGAAIEQEISASIPEQDKCSDNISFSEDGIVDENDWQCEASGSTGSPTGDFNIGGATAMPIMTALDASATAGFEATLDSLNSQNFPFIFLNSRVTDNGTPVTDLTASNFQCVENGVQQTGFFQVTPPQTGGGVRLADIVFLIDTSGSMGSAINEVKNNVKLFADALAASDVDYRLGLVQFGQSSDGGHPELFNGGNLTDNADQFKEFVSMLRATGSHEPGFLALRMAAQGFNFRPGAQKVFLLISDEDSDDRDKEGTITLLQVNDIVAHTAVDCGSGNSNSDYCNDTSVRAATGGQLFGVQGPYSEILDSIVEQTASAYIIRYKSSNPSFDGTERNIECTVTRDADQAVISDSYIPGSAPSIVLSPQTEELNQNTLPEGSPDAIIRVSVTDAVAPFVPADGVRLSYRTSGSNSAYSSITMNLNGSYYEATIPTVLNPGIDYYVTATDGQQTSSLPSTDPGINPFNIAVLPNINPAITHTPVTTANAGQPITISAHITDTTNMLVSTDLKYRCVGELLFKTLAMQNIGGDMFEATIPATEVTGDVEYYIYAKDDYSVASSEGTKDNPFVIGTGGQQQCSDGIDNDGDGKVDADDAGCHTDWDADNSNSYDSNINSEAGEDFSFVHITDVHIGSNKAMLAWTKGDDWYEYQSYPRFTDTLYEIEKMNSKPDFILIGGDNVEYNDITWLKDFELIVDDFTERTGIETYVVPGNHDRYDSESSGLSDGSPHGGNDYLLNYFQIMKFSQNATPFNITEGYGYYFNHKGFQFIGLDSGEDSEVIDSGNLDFEPEGIGLHNTVMDSLDSLINNYPDIPRVVFMHHPIFSGEKDPLGELTDSFNEETGLFEVAENGGIVHNWRRFIDYCNDNNVQIVLSGHNHEDPVFDKDRRRIVLLDLELINPLDYPLFIQTQSATKDKEDVINHGYRVIKVKNGNVEPQDAVPTSKELKKVISDLDTDGILEFGVYDYKGDLITSESENKLSSPFYISSDPNKMILYEDEQTSSAYIIKNNSNSTNSEYDLIVQKRGGDIEKGDGIYRKFGFEFDDDRLSGSEFLIFDEDKEQNFAVLDFRGININKNSSHLVAILWSKLKIEPHPFLIGRVVIYGLSYNMNQDSISSTYKRKIWTNTIDLNSPGELQVYDNNGNVTGLVNGEVKEEIPYSLYVPETETVYVFSDEGENMADNLRTRVVGSYEDTYDLTIITEEFDEETGRFEANDIPTNGSTTHQYSINWQALSQGGKGVTMQIDEDGDGEFEYSFETGSEFSDIIAPTTTSTISDTQWDAGPYTRQVQVSFTAQDNEGGVGVQKTEYSFDGEDWLEYTGTTTISEEGDHTIWYRSTDWFGNVEEAQSISFSIVSAKGLKEQAVEKMESVKYGNKTNDRRIDIMIKAINKSLDDTYWSDRNTLDSKKGSNVLRWEGKAATLLNGYITLSQQSKFAKKYNFPPETIEVFKEVLQDLLLADRIIIELAYDNIEVKEFDHPVKEKQYQKLLAQIRALIDTGNELSGTNPIEALMKYIEAWNKMMQLSKLK